MAELGEFPDSKIQKMEVDYSSTVDSKIPECESLAKVTLPIRSIWFLVFI